MLEQISIDFFSLGIGGVLGLLIGGVIALMSASRLEKENAALKATMEAEKAAMDDHFTALAGKVLESNSENFLNLAQEKLKAAQAEGKHDLDKRSMAIEQMVKPVHDHLQKLSGAVEQLHGTKKAIQDDLRNLSKETSKLVGALRNPAAQGKWGEFVLERLLDKANLVKGVHYETQVQTTEGKRPDVVIHLQDGFHIVVDAKAPINDFVERMDEDLSEGQMHDLKTNLARQVRSHVRALGGKGYWEQLDSPDFVVLFLPSEQMFSYAVQADSTLIDFAAENQVVIASPTLMLSLLRVVGLSWRQVELAKNAQDIATLGSELYDRISTFSGHMGKVGKGIESAMAAYNKCVSSFETRVLVSARKLKDLKVATADKDIDSPIQVETTPRILVSPESKPDDKDGKKVANG
ncbi:MAG: DNA recombination protein RmuC [Pseudomonadota bacterium]